MPKYVCPACGRPGGFRHANAEKACVTCGKLFVPDRSTQIHCSTPCRIQSYRSKHGLRGRPPLYPVGDMQVGDARLFPWISDSKNQPDPSANAKISRSVEAQARHAGRRFRFYPVGQGLKVERIL